MVARVMLRRRESNRKAYERRNHAFHGEVTGQRRAVLQKVDG